MKSSRDWQFAALMLVVAISWAAACAASGDDVTSSESAGAGASSAGTQATGSGGSGAATTSSTSGAAGMGGSGADGGGGGEGGAPATTGTQSGGGGMGGMPSGAGGMGGACAGVSAEAQGGPVPADIIIAVDTSGSMDLESAEVQANLNNFATIITNSGIDAHVILIADSSVCIPAPLGSGACPNDEKLPGYQHVVVGVGSTDALQKILDTYPQYAASLRPNAVKTIAVVSDDDSDLGAASFTNQLLALDPSFQGFKFDAIVAFDDPAVCTAVCLIGGCGNCPKCCPFCIPLSAAEGAVYKQLVMQTGGVIGDLCDQDFDAVFQDMATQIVANTPVSCEYDIPPPPAMMMIVPTQVNVLYSSGGNPPQTILNVPDAASCGNGGWYYDDPIMPTKVILCPSTCAVVSADPTAKIEVLFGCDTLHI